MIINLLNANTLSRQEGGDMATSRKDSEGRALRKGESQRKDDKRYVYTYTDPLGRRKFVYAADLKTLREKENELIRDQLDGLDVYAKGNATLNMVFDRYMSAKYDLRDSTKSNYLYMYDKFVKDTFGKRRIGDIKYSDVLQFYYYLVNECNLQVNTLDSIHTLLHPTFELAVRDDIIRKNPSDGVMKEIKKKTGNTTGVRHALTEEQQSIFMKYTAEHPVYYHWWTVFTVLLGTGLRIGECLGLRWEDVDFEKKVITINHSIVYYPNSETRKSYRRVSEPKTEAGIRTVPLLEIVEEALLIEMEDQKADGFNEQVIDGMKGFIFKNRYGGVPSASTINKAIERITESYNSKELLDAAREKREPVLLPHFTAHNLRHTFATRLCEVESNLKVIQSVMGHKNIETTMNIYAEATEKKKQESFEVLASKLNSAF